MTNLKKWFGTKRLVIIHWLDAASRDEWHNPADTGTAQECVTCGILVTRDDQSVTLTHTYGISDGKDHETCCSITIPYGCIVAAYEIPGADAKLVQVKGKKRCKRR